MSWWLENFWKSFKIFKIFKRSAQNAGSSRQQYIAGQHGHTAQGRTRKDRDHVGQEVVAAAHAKRTRAAQYTSYTQPGGDEETDRGYQEYAGEKAEL